MKYLAFIGIMTMFTACSGRDISSRVFDTGDSYGPGHRMHYNPDTKGTGGIRTSRPDTGN
jgi:hypothetical protein